MRIRIWWVIVALAPACGSGLTGTERSARFDDAAGLRQVLEVEASASEGRGSFTIASTIVNGSDEAATVVVRSCYLREGDLRGDREGLRVHEPLMLCATSAETVVLAPGESGATLTLSGEADAGETYALEVRHALHPEHWETATLDVPTGTDPI